VKSNLSGEFTVINPYLVRALKERGLWDTVMVNDLKHFEGSVQKIARIPEELKAIFATAFEVDTLDRRCCITSSKMDRSSTVIEPLHRCKW
jgi:ribonucleoside-diphosphate reductase alpha chain